jgi:hypothetical protein
MDTNQAIHIAGVTVGAYVVRWGFELLRRYFTERRHRKALARRQR